MMNISKTLCVMAVSAAMLASCGGSDKGDSRRDGNVSEVDMACDASFENIMDQEIDVFEYSYSNSKRQAFIVPFYMSQRDAVDSLLNDSNTFSTIVIGRELNKAEMTRLSNRKRNVRQQQIAVDAVAVIVNNANDIPSLTVDELSQILTGEARVWDDVYPSLLDSITVVFDQNGSSLMEYIKERVTGGKPFGPNVYAQGSSQGVFEAVSGIKGAIGIVGVSWLSTDMDGAALSKDAVRQRSEGSEVVELGFNPAVRVLPVSPERGVEACQPYQAYIYDGRYPLHRPIYMITTAPTGSPASAFFSFVTGSQGQKVILLTGVLPATKNARVVNLE